jgi:hypothetical protein
MNTFVDVCAGLHEFWALLNVASRGTVRKPPFVSSPCSSSRGSIGGELSAEKQQGRAKNGNAPSELFARRWNFFHAPFPSFSSLYSRSHKPRPFGRGTEATEDGGERGQARGGGLGAGSELEGRRFESREGRGVRKFGEGANRRFAALRAINRRFSKTLYRGRADADARLTHNLASLEHLSRHPYAMQALTPSRNRSPLYAMQGLTPCCSKEKSPKNLPACL